MDTKYPNMPYHVSNSEVHCVSYIFLVVIFAGFHVAISQSDTCGTDLNTDKQVYSIGDTIHIHCSTSSSLIPDPSQFYLIHTTNTNNQGTNVSAIFETTGSIAMATINVKDTSVAGTYICYYGDCATVLLTSFQTIEVRSPSSPSLTCVWENRWNLTCSWEGRETEGRQEWRMSYKPEGTTTNSCCVGPSGTCWEFSYDQSCCIAADKTVPYLTYAMQLESRWIDNSTAKYNYTIDVDESILRCNLDHVTGSTSTTRQLDLTTTSDCSPASVGGLICHVTATSQWEPNNTVSQTCDSRSGGLQVNCTVTGLEPYTRYNLGVTCRPRSSSYWSNTLVTTARTLTEPPVMAPGIIGYSENAVDKQFRDIVLYLEPLPDRQRYGAEAFINIIFETNGMAYERVINASSTSVRLNVTFHTTKTYEVTMVASNEQGMSTNSSTITIGISQPSSADVVVDHRIDVNDARLNGASYDVMLFGRSPHSHVIKTCYYSCRLPVAYDDRKPPLCEAMLNQMCVPGYHQSYTIDIDPVNRIYVSNRQMADGVRFVTNASTDEIYWSNCVFYQRPDDRPAPYITWRRTNESTVDVDLSNVRYCDDNFRPLVYQIDVRTASTNHSCPMEDADNITATPELRHIPLSVDPKDRVLSVCFAVLYTGVAYPAGIDDASAVQDATATSARPVRQAGPGSKPSVQIAIGVALGVGVGLLAMVIIGLRKYHQRIKSRNLVQDILPGLGTLPQADTSVSGYIGRYDDSAENHDVNHNYSTLHDVSKNTSRSSYTKIDEKTSLEVDLSRDRNGNDMSKIGRPSAGQERFDNETEKSNDKQRDISDNNKHKTVFENVATFELDDNPGIRQANTQISEMYSRVLQNVTDQDQCQSAEVDENEDTEISDSADMYMVASRSDADMTGGDSQVDSYTVMTYSSDSGQSVADYVTTTEITSY